VAQLTAEQESSGTATYVGAFYTPVAVSPEVLESEIEPLYDEGPDGLLFHHTWATASSETRIFDVWDCSQARDRFAARLLPALLHASCAPYRSTPVEPVEPWPTRARRWWGMLEEE
jgi:hypothetical protein